MRIVFPFTLLLSMFLIPAFLALAVPSQAQTVQEIGVNSPAVRFSPGNWSGDTGRGGANYRQSWTNGAYCTWVWSTTSAAPTALLGATNVTPGSTISYFIDGHLVDNVPVPATGGIEITDLTGAGRHVLTVYLRNSRQEARWDDSNACKITGLVVDNGATPGAAPSSAGWTLIVGDSITEGILADNGADDNLDDYSFLIGQALRQQGMDYGLSACGYSGWLRPGDAGGDVPAYYAVSHGVYDAAHSRWDKIDDHTSLLDSQGHLSAYGGTGQEPSAILINYATNEALAGSDLGDMQQSVTQSLLALRRAAPRAWICIFVPFGLENTRIYPHGAEYIQALRAGVVGYEHRQQDSNITMVDLGVSVANALASAPYGGNVHPNAAGHAYLTTQILPIILPKITAHQHKKG